MKFEKSCGAIVLDENKVLVVTHQAGHTDFPKGHMEGNEIEEETAIREVKEETNIDIELLPYRYSIFYSPRLGVKKEVVFFAAKKRGGEISPQLEEVSSVQWIPIEEADTVLTYDSAKELLQKVRNDWKNSC